MNKVRVVSAITSKAGITLYLDDGKTLHLSSNSWRTTEIMSKILRPLAERKRPEIDLDDYSLEARITAKTGGFVTFLKRKWSEFTLALGGVLPDGATPDRETTVAVVNGKEIPGMEKIEAQMEYAALQDATGFQAFLDRLSRVIDERGHTVQELLDFISKGDLPIADDGMIVAYKSLYRDDKGYIDCYSRTVKQRIGSLVEMEVDLVDANRRVECSHGLHVGRRGYMRVFTGDVMTLITIDPANVVAVPLKDPNKMRVAAYHIVGELSHEGRAEIMSDKPMTSVQADAQLLAKVLRGNRVPIIERVRVGKTGVLRQTVAPMVAPQVSDGSAKALDDAEPREAISIETVRDVVSAVAAEKKSKKETPKAANENKAKKSAAKKVAADKVTAAPAKAPKQKVDAKSFDHIPEKWRNAYIAVTSKAMSQREAEKVYNISAKKLRALLRDNGDL